MSFAFVRDVPIDEGQYAEVRAALGDEVPKGLVAHLALRRERGLRYIDVWESEADWDRFHEDRLRPVVTAMMARHGMTPPAVPLPTQPIEVVDAWLG